MASFVNPKEPGSYFCHTCFDFSLFYLCFFTVPLLSYILSFSVDTYNSLCFATLLAVVTLILLSFNK